MRKKDIIEMKIEKIEYPDTGVGYFEGRKVKVKKALPDQIVKARIRRVNSKKIEAVIVDVVEKAPFEIDSFCEHFENCGGCSYQTLDYEKQLELKSESVLDLLEKAGIEGFDYLGIEPSPEIYAYRNKMEFTFGDMEKGGEMTLGMHEKGKHMDITTVDQCKIADEDFTKILAATLDYFKSKEIPKYNKKQYEGILRHLLLRKGKKTNELLINLGTTSQGDFDKQEYLEVLQALDLKGDLVGVLNTINDGKSDTFNCDKINIIFGRDYLYENLFDLSFKISAFSFFQTNTLATEKLYDGVLDFIDETQDKIIFDLYAGTGTIGQVAALKAKKVIGIELVEEAVAAANENAALNKLDNCHFIAGDVFEKLNEVQEKPDIIIVDPPRSGIQEKALEKILSYKVNEIIYVSCNPKTMVENLKTIETNGYKATKIKIFDNFPHTTHIESVVRIVKQ